MREQNMSNQCGSVGGSNDVVDVDIVVMSIVASFQSSDSQHHKGSGKAVWQLNRRKPNQTTREGVYAVTGAATVILVMGAGKKAVAAIDAYLKNKFDICEKIPSSQFE